MKTQDYDDDVLQAFLDEQDQLFDEPVAESLQESCASVACGASTETQPDFLGPFIECVCNHLTGSEGAGGKRVPLLLPQKAEPACGSGFDYGRPSSVCQPVRSFDGPSEGILAEDGPCRTTEKGGHYGRETFSSVGNGDHDRVFVGRECRGSGFLRFRGTQAAFERVYGKDGFHQGLELYGTLDFKDSEDFFTFARYYVCNSDSSEEKLFSIVHGSAPPRGHPFMLSARRDRI